MFLVLNEIHLPVKPCLVTFSKGKGSAKDTVHSGLALTTLGGNAGLILLVHDHRLPIHVHIHGQG